MIPFSASTELDYDRIESVDSEEINKDLKEIEEYLRRNNPSSGKKLY
jgi:uncharacterized protein YgfB (UPF0149 family)